MVATNQKIVHQLKVRGTIEIDLPEGEKIDPEMAYALALNEIENKDGKVTRTIENDIFYYTYYFVTKSFGVLSAGKKLFKTKSKGSPSQKLRMVIMEQADALGLDREQHYHNKIAEFIQQIDNELQ